MAGDFFAGRYFAERYFADRYWQAGTLTGTGSMSASLSGAATVAAALSAVEAVELEQDGGSGNRARRRRPMVKTLEEQRAENDAIVTALLRRVAGPTPAEQAAILARHQDEEAVLALLLAA